MKRHTWISPEDIAIEVLSRSKVIEAAARIVWRAARALAAWLGEEASTPNTGTPPFVSPSQPGTWSGVILIHRNRAEYWILLPSGDAMGGNLDTRPRHHADTFEDDPYFEGYTPNQWGGQR